MAKQLKQISENDWPELQRFLLNVVPSGHISNYDFNKHWFGRHDGNWSGFLVVDTEYDDHIVGIMMVIEVPVLLFNLEKKMGWISTGAVDETVRSTAVGPQLYFRIYKHYDVVGALSGNSNSLPINSLLGNSILDLTMVRYLFVNRKEVSALVNTDDIIPINSYDKLREKDNYNITEQNSLPNGYSELWGKVKNNFDVVINKTAEYLEWRYIESPIIRYKILVINRNEQLVAVSVVRIQETFAGNVLRVLELIVDDCDIASALSLVSQYSIDIGCIFTDFFVIGHYYNDALNDIGYLSSIKDKEVELIPHLLSPVEHRRWSNTFHLGGNSISDNCKWNDPRRILFTKGDSDRDWPTEYDVNIIDRCDHEY